MHSCCCCWACVDGGVGGGGLLLLGMCGWGCGRGSCAGYLSWRECCSLGVLCFLFLVSVLANIWAADF